MEYIIITTINVTILIPDKSTKVSGSCSLSVPGPVETPGHDWIVKQGISLLCPVSCMLKVRNSCGCWVECVRQGQARTQSDWTAVWWRRAVWVRGVSVIDWCVREVKVEPESSEGKGRGARVGRVKGHQRFWCGAFC